MQVGPKNSNFQRFYEFFFFFRTTELQLKLLIIIKSPNVFHWKSIKKQSGCGLTSKIWAKKVKKLALSIVFFHILHGEYI